MRPICIDFAPASATTARARLAPWGVLALLLALVLTGVGLRGWQLAAQAAREAKARVAQATPAPNPNPLSSARRSEVQPRLSQAQAELLREAVLRLNRPWTTLFDDLEHAGRGPLALLEVRVDALSGRVRGSAEARHKEAMLAFIEALDRQEGLSEARLLRHEVNPSDANNPVGFDFEVRWRGAP